MNMKRKALIIISIAVIAIVVILALKPFAKKKADFTFDTVKVERGDITNTVTATGTIEAITTVRVGTQVSGIIERIYVDFNDNVKQGQILARLDETSLKAQLEQSQATVDQALAQMNFQAATYKRLKALYEKNLIAQSDYDQAVYNYENSKASLNNAKSSLARAEVNLNYATIKSPIDGVVLNRAVEEGQTVAASFNTPEMFTIVNDLTQMEVQTSVDEADIGRVKQNQRVEFTVDAYPELKFEGTVSQVRLQPVTTNNVVTYVVILSAPNPDKKLMPGMTASATIYVEEKANVLKLSGKAFRFTPDISFLQKMMAKMAPPSNGQDMPLPAVAGQMSSSRIQAEGGLPQGMPPAGMFSEAGSSDPEMKTVWIKDEKMILRPVLVKTGIENGSAIEVLSGVAEGDEVIIAMNDGTVKKTTTRATGGPFPF